MLFTYMHEKKNKSCILSILSYPRQIQLRTKPAHDLLEGSQHLLLLEKELRPPAEGLHPAGEGLLPVSSYGPAYPTAAHFQYEPVP